jgi:hypothetical protein
MVVVVSFVPLLDVGARRRIPFLKGRTHAIGDRRCRSRASATRRRFSALSTLDSPGSCARLISESILLRRQFTPGIYEFLAATKRDIGGGNPKGESIAMIRGPSKIAPG